MGYARPWRCPRIIDRIRCGGEPARYDRGDRAGIIGAAVTWCWRWRAKGRRVCLLDRAEPGVAGELRQCGPHRRRAGTTAPLPKPTVRIWRELESTGGPLYLPPRQVLRMLPWIGRFAAAALRRAENTRHLAPLVRPAAADWARWLGQIGRPELLRRHGHYEIGFGPEAEARARAQARLMARLGVRLSRSRAKSSSLAERLAEAVPLRERDPDARDLTHPCERRRLLAKLARARPGRRLVRGARRRPRRSRSDRGPARGLDQD